MLTSNGELFWGFVVLGIAILLGVLAYSSFKKEKGTPKTQKKTEPALCGVGGAHDGALIPLREPLILGRDSGCCNVVLPAGSKGISGVHCKVSCAEGRVELTDLGSTYGTFLESGERLTPHVPYCIERGGSFYLADRKYTYRVC